MEYNILRPLVSILIPTFNREDVIERALKSALNQTYDNCEIVIVDDGSTDNTKNLLKPYLSERVRLVEHFENKGITSARNTLLDNARGEWIAFLSSDDELKAESIEIVMQKSREFPEANWFYAHMIDMKSGEYACLDEYEGFMPQGVLTHPNNCCNEAWYVARMNIIGSDRFVEELNSFEGEWLLKISNRAKRYFINIPLYIYHTEYVNRVSKSYENGTATMPMDEQWVKFIKERPNYLIDRYNSGLGDIFDYVVNLLIKAGEPELAQVQIEIARKYGIEILEVESPASAVRVSILVGMKRLVVRMLRFLKLKAPKPPFEQ